MLSLITLSLVCVTLCDAGVIVSTKKEEQKPAENEQFVITESIVNGEYYEGGKNCTFKKLRNELAEIRKQLQLVDQLNARLHELQEQLKGNQLDHYCNQ